jgi:hypothetical protein
VRLTALTVAALLALTGCGGDAEAPREPATSPPPGMPAGGSSGPQDPDARTYPSSKAVIAAVNRWTLCQPIIERDPDMYADTSITCVYQAGPDRTDVVKAATFDDPIQQESAMLYYRCLQEPVRGRGVVYGDGWLVVVAGRESGSVVRVTGGRWAGPKSGCAS